MSQNTWPMREMNCVEVATYTDPSRFSGRPWKQAARPAGYGKPLDSVMQRSVERAGATFNPTFLVSRTFAEPVTIRYRDTFDFGDQVERLVQHGAPAKAATAFKFISDADQGSPPAWWLGTGEDCPLCFNRVRHRRCLPLQDGPRAGERAYP